MRSKRSKAVDILAVAANAAVILCVLAGLWAVQMRYGRFYSRAPRLSTFRTFTSLSNAFAAATCAVMIPFRLRSLLGGKARPPRWALDLRFAGACAVSVTFWTVLVYIGPAAGYHGQYADSGFWLHAVAPAACVLSFLLLERGGRISLWEGLLGALPVVLYGAVYYERVIVRRAWSDFYHFNVGGRWPVSMAAMLLASLAVAYALRALYHIPAGRSRAGAHEE